MHAAFFVYGGRVDSYTSICIACLFRSYSYTDSFIDMISTGHGAVFEQVGVFLLQVELQICTLPDLSVRI